MKRTGLALLLMVVVIGTLEASTRMASRVASVDDDDDAGIRLSATLRGSEEPPAVSTLAKGSFLAELSDDGMSLEYTLKYTNLQGNVLQSHIHLGQKGVNGGIAAFLCTNLANGPAGTPLCPGPNTGEVSGTIAAAQIVGPAGQGLAIGEFEEFLRAIDKDLTYVNVHSSLVPSGEMRGQIDVHDGDDDDDDDDDN